MSGSLCLHGTNACKCKRYNRLLRLLQVDTEEAGASFYHLSNLTTLGVDIVVGDGHMQLLEAHLDQRTPVIASVDTRELTYWNGLWRFHAVVVTGIEGSQITINDPAFATSQIVPTVQFESAWLEREYVYATIKVRR